MNDVFCKVTPIKMEFRLCGYNGFNVMGLLSRVKQRCTGVSILVS